MVAGGAGGGAGLEPGAPWAGGAALFGGGTMRRVSCRADCACPELAARKAATAAVRRTVEVFMIEPNVPQSGLPGKAKQNKNLHIQFVSAKRSAMSPEDAGW